MARLGVDGKLVLILGLALRIHHQFHGPAIDYVGLAAAAAASSAGVPGPGEPVLIAASIFAARHSLSIGSVIAVAWAGAAAGGMVGWWVGLKAGRTVWTAPGPLQRWRCKTIEHGEQVFARHPLLAVQLTPSWVAGIHGVKRSTYILMNAISALTWAAGIGLAAYYIGPAVVDMVNDVGLATGVALVVLVVVTILGASYRRRRLRDRHASGAEQPTTKR